MPSCDGSDIPMSRGKARKPDKLYQYVYDAHGMFHVTKHLVRDGEQQVPCGSKDVKTREMMEEIDDLHNQSESSIGIRDFDVPYSLNKSKLWQRVAEAKETIAAMQDYRSGIRCTVYSQNKDTLCLFCQPVITKERLIEYHTIDENFDEVHRFTKPTCHVEFESFWMEKQRKKNEGQKKKKKASEKVLMTSKGDSSVEPHTRIPLNHEAHILYREVNSEYSLSWANGQKRFMAGYCSKVPLTSRRGRKMSKANRREIWEYYHSERGFIWSDAISGLCGDDLSYCDYDEGKSYTPLKPRMGKQRKKNEVRKKKKKASKKCLITSKEDSSVEPRTRLLFSHKPHILYREVNSEYSLSWANSQKRRPSKCYFKSRGRKMRKAVQREIWEYYHSERDSIWSDPISGLYEEDLSYCDYEEDLSSCDYGEDLSYCDYEEGLSYCDYKEDLSFCDYDGAIFYDDEYAWLFRNYCADAEICYIKRGLFCLNQNVDLFRSEEFHRSKHPKKQA